MHLSPRHRSRAKKIASRNVKQQWRKRRGIKKKKHKTRKEEKKNYVKRKVKLLSTCAMCFFFHSLEFFFSAWFTVNISYTFSTFYENNVQLIVLFRWFSFFFCNRFIWPVWLVGTAWSGFHHKYHLFIVVASKVRKKKKNNNRRIVTTNLDTALT